MTSVMVGAAARTACQLPPISLRQIDAPVDRVRFVVGADNEGDGRQIVGPTALLNARSEPVTGAHCVAI